MAVTEVIETERKYEVDVALSVPNLSAVSGVVAVHTEVPVTLRAVYFDTVDGALASAGYTLRRREGGHDAGWHLKTPSPLGRTEHRVELVPHRAGARANDIPPPPRELVDLVLSRTRHNELAPVARITTVRTATVLMIAESGRAEVGAGSAATAGVEIADDRVEATDLRDGTLRLWREWEVELLDPAAGFLMDAIEQVLIEAGATPSESP
jgi:hypothetical protein